MSRRCAPSLSPHGFLTRDSRVVERKKYGKAKARRRLPVLQAIGRALQPVLRLGRFGSTEAPFLFDGGNLIS